MALPMCDLIFSGCNLLLYHQKWCNRIVYLAETNHVNPTIKIQNWAKLF